MYAITRPLNYIPPATRVAHCSIQHRTVSNHCDQTDWRHSTGAGVYICGLQTLLLPSGGSALSTVHTDCCLLKSTDAPRCHFVTRRQWLNWQCVEGGSGRGANGIGVTTNAAFRQFAALESRSEVIQGHTFWPQSKASVRLYIQVINSIFRPIFSHLEDNASFIRTEPTV